MWFRTANGSDEGCGRPAPDVCCGSTTPEKMPRQPMLIASRREGDELDRACCRESAVALQAHENADTVGTLYLFAASRLCVHQSSVSHRLTLCYGLPSDRRQIRLAKVDPRFHLPAVEHHPVRRGSAIRLGSAFNPSCARHRNSLGWTVRLSALLASAMSSTIKIFQGFRKVLSSS